MQHSKNISLSIHLYNSYVSFSRVYKIPIELEVEVKRPHILAPENPVLMASCLLARILDQNLRYAYSKKVIMISKSTTSHIIIIAAVAIRKNKSNNLSSKPTATSFSDHATLASQNTFHHSPPLMALRTPYPLPPPTPVASPILPPSPLTPVSSLFLPPTPGGGGNATSSHSLGSWRPKRLNQSQQG